MAGCGSGYPDPPCPPRNANARRPADRPAWPSEQKAQKRKQTLRRTITVIIVAAVVFGISYAIFKPGKQKAAATTTTSTTSHDDDHQAGSVRRLRPPRTSASPPRRTARPTSTATLPNPQWKSPPPMTIDPTKTYTATINTDVGTSPPPRRRRRRRRRSTTSSSWPTSSSTTASSSTGSSPTFMDQTGDPTGTGDRRSRLHRADEVPATANPQYPIGSLAMAKTPRRPTGPRATSSSSWPVARARSLPPDYALFGQVTSGRTSSTRSTPDGDASDDGTPPTVIHRMLSVTVTES